jgi:DNA-directed RNA polymerase subunit omega
MARVTVEDCIMNIPNRFELVITAAQRAKQIASGSPLTVDRDNDKDGVVSLREIAEETIDIPMVQEEMIQGFQKQFQFDRSEGLDEDVPAIGHGGRPVEEVFSDAEHLMQEDMRQNYAGSLSFIEDNVEVDD